MSVPILVIGVRSGSFGETMMARLGGPDYKAEGYEPIGADRIQELSSPLVALEFDLGWSVTSMVSALREVRPQHVVCCAGINVPDGAGEDLAELVRLHLEVNAIGFVRLAQAFSQVSYPGSHLVAVSSNSARIPRSPSLGYCVSKAAMSMAVQVLARKWADEEGRPWIWGVEPGFMATDSSLQAVDRRLYGGPAHRMKGVGPYGLSPMSVANHVGHCILTGGVEMNGVLLRMDAGEL